MANFDKVIHSSNKRFEIDNEGWRRMNAGRKAADLIREAISNTFDAEDVSEVRVNLSPGMVIVEDDSHSGIGDVNLITTVFMTNKVDSHLKRGRKGRGIKELISAAEYAEVDTVGQRVIFNEGRTVTTSSRKRGTKVTVKVKNWGAAEIHDACTYLNRIIPPEGVKFFINNTEVIRRKTRTYFNAHLQTQIVEGDIQKSVYRYGDVHIVNLAKGEREGWVYEMGVPVQQIPAPFHIDVQQRIPLNDNRDSVDSYWLSCLYGDIIKVLVRGMSLGAMKYMWFQFGLSYIYDVEISSIILRKLFGDLTKVALKSDNPLANDVARQHGYLIIDTKSASDALVRIMEGHIPSADKIAGKIEEQKVDTEIDPDVIDPTGRLRDLTQYLAINLIGQKIHVNFFARQKDFTGAIRLAHFSKKNMTLGFNTISNLNLKDATSPLILSTICHELTHYYVDNHDVEFLTSFQDMSGRMAKLFLEHRDEIATLLGIRIAEKRVPCRITTTSEERA